MAHNPYKSYSSKKRKRQNRLYFLLAIIVIIVVIYFLQRAGGGGEIPSPNNEVVDTTDNVETPQPDPEIESDEPIEPSVVEVEPKETEPQEPEIPDESEKTEAQPEETVDPEIVALMKEAQEKIASGDIIAARNILNDLLNDPALAIAKTPDIANAAKTQLARLSMKWLFSKDHIINDPLTALYKVQPGETLEKIGKKHKVPWEILKSINNIKDEKLLMTGQKIKVINGPFHANIYRSSFKMDLYLGIKTYVKTYGVGLGEVGKDTPTGWWLVGDKLPSPPWPRPEGGYSHPGDSDYPLGSRWIALSGVEGNAKGRTGFGIHGTKDPETIGTRSSQGCIRLYNGEVIELYDLLMPGLSKVHVVE